ncbi:S1 RNA binding family protein [Streptomyces sp. 846.5]|nr:S1 RNA-binding domain-containing protein [Streptomyces sp. 846.5]TDU04478.1 S1 RNA binding family protein [Streptomyces sp. 846.5]
MVQNSRLMRDERPEAGTVFTAMAYGERPDAQGNPFDYDQMYKNALVPTIESLGMTPTRADAMYGGDSVLSAVWHGIQTAEIVLVVFSNESVNVAMEFMLSYIIGKKMIYLTQDPKEIPSDVKDLRTITYSSDWRHMDRMKVELRLALEAVHAESATEMALVPLIGGGSLPVPARVVSTTRELAVVETDDGRHGVLSAHDVDYSRVIPDMSAKFAIGARLNGAFDVDTKGDMRYTLQAGVSNPWPVLAAEYPVGRTFTGTVHNVHPTLGAFVAVAGGVNGLLPHDPSMPFDQLRPGDRVEVSVARMDVERRRVLLRAALPPRFTSVGRSRPPAPPSDPTGPAVGDRLDGEVIKASPEGQGGYALLKLPGRTRPAILHCTAMSAELREDLNAGLLTPGDLLWVEVTSVDSARDRLLLKDLPEAEDEDEAAAA